MAAARCALVAGIVAGQADQRGLVVTAHFKGGAASPDVLVVVIQPVGQVLAEPAARQPGNRTADAHQVRDRRRCGDDPISLIVSAISAARLERKLLRQRLGDVLHRAANGVAAIQRALRPAQHFDPLDIVDIEHGGLRAVEIYVIKVDADALLEARDRILLADTADEGGQRGVGAARGFQRHVRRRLRQFGDVDRAGARKLIAAERRDGDRNIDQPLLTATGGDDDPADPSRQHRSHDQHARTIRENTRLVHPCYSHCVSLWPLLIDS